MRYPVFYTSRLIRGTTAGLTIGPVCLIQRRYRGDAGLRAHEVEHALAFWRTLGLDPILRLLSRRYRLNAEARAFARQVLPDYSNIDDLAGKLARDVYRLGITPAQARVAIARHLPVGVRA